MAVPERQRSTTEEDVVWASPDGVELLARVYRPRERSRNPAPLLLNVHGGIWSSGDRTGDVAYCRALARRGATAASIDFRQAPAFQHPISSVDVRNALRWIRLHALEWGGASSVGIMGGSSGGHLAMLAAIEYDAPRLDEVSVPIVDIDGDAHVRLDIPAHADYVVAIVPVSDPYFRYNYARRAKLTGLVEGAESYFVTAEAMRAVSVPRIVVAGEAAALPPLLVVQAGDDANVPLEMTMDLLRAWQSREGHLEYAFFPGQWHGFALSKSPVTDQLATIIADFASRHSRVD